VRLLVDTHLLLWGMIDDPRFPSRARDLIVDPANTVFVSRVTVWETAVKRALKRYSDDFPFSPERVVEEADLAGFRWLSIEDEHLFTLAGLPLLHRDPFDRLLVAQALAEPLRLITHDRQIAAYSDTVILV
jgi:PIN domain nuclease of toxin-antitoxin system